MPNSDRKKIKSAPRAPGLGQLLLAICLFAFTATFGVLTNIAQSKQSGDLVRLPLQVPGYPHIYNVQVAATARDRAKGLAGQRELAPKAGMLFVLDAYAPSCFWMKGMLIPVDMVWLDHSRRVVDIKERADPASFPQRYCSGGPAKYVVELSAGEVQKSGIAIGERLQF